MRTVPYLHPANVTIGTHKNMVIASVPEGHDKPYKYPGMFAKADIVLLNKIDLKDVFDFDVEYFSHGVEIVNPSVQIIGFSCKTNEGTDSAVIWINNLK